MAEEINNEGSKVFELNEYDELVVLNNSKQYVDAIAEFTKEWNENWTNKSLQLLSLTANLGDLPEYHKICTFLKLYPDNHDKISNIILINIYIENMCQRNIIFNKKNSKYLISYSLNKSHKFEKYVVDILLDYYKKYKYIGINKYIDQINIPDLDDNKIYILGENDDGIECKENYYMSVELLEKLKDAKIIVKFCRQIINYYTNRKNYSCELYELLKYIYINNLDIRKLLQKYLLYYVQSSELFLKYIEDFNINDNNIIIEGLCNNQNAFSMDILKLFINKETIGKIYYGSNFTANILTLVLEYNIHKVKLDDIKYIVEFAKCNNVDLMLPKLGSNWTPLKCIINKKITDYENIIYYLVKETILSEQIQ